MTKVAWHLKRNEIQNSQPNETKKQFVYNISRSGYRKEWGHTYEKPGVYARTQALFLRVVPKIGPFSGLAFHPPTPAVEQLYMHSFNDALDHYRALLLAQQEHRLQLPNENLDTGAATGAAKYRLADQTYAKLLRETSGKPVSDGSAAGHSLLLRRSGRAVCNQTELEGMAGAHQGIGYAEIDARSWNFALH